ncbi:MAG: DUF805 domain-containing protein [Nitrospira sp.]|nr:DUF805 domain-containing protein [bacterium]MBL7050496.1 DUF805 domain-containing protein [Nitrospira sp.]
MENKSDNSWTWFLFSLKGRVSRKQYWIFNLIIFCGGILLGTFTDLSSDLNNIPRPQLMFMIWIFWPSIAVQAKRWHDLDKSAWWIAISLIPVIGPIWALIENGFFAGTTGTNRFGPEPTEGSINK